MSSRRSSVELVPKRRFRLALLASSATGFLIGAGLILELPLLWPFKVGLGAVWVLAGVIELRHLLQGMSRIERIRIVMSGEITALASSGAVEPLELLRGSVVLSRIGWLRLRFSDGLCYGELVVGNRRDHDWRRLQRFWRQRVAVFGEPRVS